MTLYEFRALDLHKQAETVWEQGVFVAKREEGAYKLMLYQLPSFYVEVWYLPVNNKIDGLRSFISTGPLEPYLQEIDVTKLL